MSKTTVGIKGTDITINGQPTYAGRTYEGQRIEGMLFNVRAAQAIFDDANPQTRPNWAYPDTGEWDAERNVDEFCAALPEWKAHGILAFTVNLQGGGAIYSPEVYHHYDNNGFTSDGHLKPDYAARLEKVLAAADELGMVVILGFFYWIHVQKMDGEAALFRAADETMTFLESTGYKNVLIEIANEIEVVVSQTKYDLFQPDNIPALIYRLRNDHPGFLYSTSQGGVEPDTGRSMPTPALISAVDFVMPHGNLATPESLERAMKQIKAMPEYLRQPKPIIINEDSPSMPKFEVCWPLHVSWGYYDQGFGSEQNLNDYIDYRGTTRETTYADLSGFQTPPVNWGINTEHKRAFFQRVKEITGV